jgi:tetratricopeptide (TPR) repeat protein
MSAHGIFYKKLSSKNFLFYSFCVLCVCLVAANIVYSQNYNASMYGVMGGETRSTVSYLSRIWGTPLYDFEMQTYKNEGKSEIMSAWAQVQQTNAKRIQNLESFAALHPYSPELYYNLSLLYSENGDKIKAAENLRKAQQIDPSIK